MNLFRSNSNTFESGVSSRGGALDLPGVVERRFLPMLGSARRAESTSQRRERLLIVGNGMVGQRFCEALTRLGGHERFQITVLGEEPTPAYDRVHLTDIWHGKNPEELMLRDHGWYEHHSLELRLGECVQSIDAERRRVTTVAGTEFGYDRLVLATGSRVMPLSLGHQPGVKLLTYRTLGDAQRILAEVNAAGERSAIVIGAGLLGLEAARALQRLGCRVTVLEASSQVLPKQLDPEAAQVLLELLTKAGISIRTRARIVSVEADAAGIQCVSLDGGEAVSAELIVAAVGARASDELARAAGLVCEIKGGVRVDDQLRTSAARIYAVGECAHHPRVPHGLVAPGYAMADVLAQVLMGKPGRLQPQEAITRLKLDLTEVTVLGNPLSPDAGRDWIWQEPGVYRRLVVNRRRIVSAVCVGAFSDLPALQRLITTRKRVPLKTLDVFKGSGRLSVDGADQSAQSFPDAQVVCNCANVTCGRLRAAFAEGQSDVAALGRATAAGTLCGSCQPVLAELCGVAPSVSAAKGRAERGMLGISLAAAALASVTLLVPRVPLSTSVQLQGLDVLWTDSQYKQVSGFVLVGLIVLGLLLSLRKRALRFRFGAYSSWRLAHTALGLSALAMAFGHTGFRLGYNLNQALMLAFLLSALTGGLSGVLLVRAAAAPQSSTLARSVRVARTLHDYVFWPLCVLVGFHVLKVYYF